MTIYLPDSTVLIGFGRGDQFSTEWIQRMVNSAEDVISCPITIAECLAGARPSERIGWEEIFSVMRFVPLESPDAVLSGVYRYDFARRGVQIALGDSLIAALARRLGAVVVTNNAKDFPMPDVRVQPFP